MRIIFITVLTMTMVFGFKENRTYDGTIGWCKEQVELLFTKDYVELFDGLPAGEILVRLNVLNTRCSRFIQDKQKEIYKINRSREIKGNAIKEAMDID